MGWLYGGNSGNETDKRREWTMTRYGWMVRHCNSLNIRYDNGKINIDTYYSEYDVRPVFYVGSTGAVSSGTGTSSDPFIIAK